MKTPGQWRYAVVGLGFLGLSGVRAAQDAPVWAAVFAVAAVANAWLALRETTEPQPAPVDPARLEPSEVRRSLDGYRTSARQWQILGIVGVLTAGGLLLLTPVLAMFAGAAALFALHRAHRAGRAVTTLRYVAAVSR